MELLRLHFVGDLGTALISKYVRMDQKSEGHNPFKDHVYVSSATGRRTPSTAAAAFQAKLALTSQRGHHRAILDSRCAPIIHYQMGGAPTNINDSIQSFRDSTTLW